MLLWALAKVFGNRFTVAPTALSLPTCCKLIIVSGPDPYAILQMLRLSTGLGFCLSLLSLHSQAVRVSVKRDMVALHFRRLVSKAAHAASQRISHFSPQAPGRQVEGSCHPASNPAVLPGGRRHLVGTSGWMCMRSVAYLYLRFTMAQSLRPL